MQKNKRVLWLINPKQFQESEISILTELGYEIYLPKQLPKPSKSNVELTIPVQQIEQLNQHNFYEEPLSLEITHIINEYFNLAFFSFNEIVFQELVHNFNGEILLRVRDSLKDTTYTKEMNKLFNSSFFDKLAEISHRFWFLPSSSEISDKEASFLQKRTIVLPFEYVNEETSNKSKKKNKLDKNFGSAFKLKKLSQDIEEEPKKELTWDDLYAEWLNKLLPKVSKANRKIAVFLPIGYRGGSLNGAKNIAKILHLGSRLNNDPVDVVFSCIDNYYDMEQDFGELKELGIQVRETTWNMIPRDAMKACLNFLGKDTTLDAVEYTFPIDKTSNFHDCDFWFLVSDRTNAPLAPIKPYCVLVYDYIQRYIPDIFGEYFEAPFLATVRDAKFILTTTPGTRGDAIQYAGVPEERVHLMSMEFDPFYVEPKQPLIKSNYFIWTTNSSMHKNHLVAVEALAIYYNELNGKLDVVMTGALTQHFKNPATLPIPYIEKVHATILKHSVLKKRLKIMGELPVGDYISTLAAAKFLWHPTLKDNGTYSVVEAAYYGVPSLSSDYPQMRFIDKTFHLNMSFSDLHNAKKIANQLKKMELEHMSLKKKLPSQKFLEQFSYKKLASKGWLLIKDLL